MEDGRSGTVLAFDFGVKRIGVAVGELALSVAHPLAVIRAERNDARFGRIAELIAQWDPRLLLVGLPARMDGSEHEMTRRCRRFAKQLAGRFGLPVDTVDERLSTAAAEQQLRESGAASRARKDAVDAIAAAVILQSYFDEPAGSRATH